MKTVDNYLWYHKCDIINQGNQNENNVPPSSGGPQPTMFWYDVMNYKRKNNLGSRRRKDRYTGWGGKKSFKIDYFDKKLFNKKRYLILR